MSRKRIRLLLVAALVSLNLFVLAGPLHAQGDTVSGNLQIAEGTTLSRNAVAVVTLTDRSKDGAGTIIGQQRIDGATGTDAFSVQYDPTIINTKHAYSIYASIIDGANEYQNLTPIPVITGGPVDGLAVPVESPAYQVPAQITGTIALPTGVTTSDTAIAYAAILDQTTGRLVSRDVIVSPTTYPAPFTVGFDAALSTRRTRMWPRPRSSMARRSIRPLRPPRLRQARRSTWSPTVEHHHSGTGCIRITRRGRRPPPQGTRARVRRRVRVRHRLQPGRPGRRPRRRRPQRLLRRRPPRQRQPLRPRSLRAPQLLLRRAPAQSRARARLRSPSPARSATRTRGSSPTRLS